MRFLRRYIRRLLNFATRRRTDERLREEIEWHLAILTEENIRAGMSAGEGRRHARMDFGAVEVVREQYRDEESVPFLENLLLDLRYAVRVLLKSPAFSLVALLTVTLGIAANVFVFGILNAVIFQPLDVSDPQNLYQLRHEVPMSGRLLTNSYPAFEDFRRRNTAFSDMAAFNGYSSADLKTHAGTTKVYGYEVTGNYFDLLDVAPAAGHFFHEQDVQGKNSALYIVLSDDLWRKTFHANPQVIGQVVNLNQRPFTVMGVSPASFHGTERFVWPDYWIPMSNEQQVATDRDYLHSRTYTAVTVIGRVRPGVTPEQAAHNLTAISAEMAEEHPTTDERLSLRLIHPGLYGDEGVIIRRFLYAISVLALLVLGAVCANLASLSAARFAGRRRELAMRVALGAGRLRLIRQLLIESLLLATIGGSLGLILGVSLLYMVDQWRPALGHLAISIDWRVYLAGLSLTVGSAVLFGLLPAWQVSRRSPSQMMKGPPVGSNGLRRFLSHDLLLSIQTAICTVLVMASLVAVRGMTRTLHAPLGFQPHDALLVNVDMGRLVPTSGQGGVTVRAILTSLSRIPGISAAGAVNRLPMTGGLHGTPIFYAGAKKLKVGDATLLPYAFGASPGYLRAAGTQLLAGRDISWQDETKVPAVAIINETFAKRMWPEASALGQRFIVAGHLTEVVGIAENGKYHDLQEASQPVLYLPLLRAESHDAIFVVRSQIHPNDIASQLETSLAKGQSQISITVRSWDSALETELFPSEVAMVALGVLGLLAAMLAVTGIFGMATYNVSRRMKEFGIYVALGARKITVMNAAVGRPMILLLIGLFVGVGSGVLSERFWGRLVYQARPGDPVVIGGTVFAMVVLGISASAIPAHRAISVNPSRLMRQE